MGFVSATEFGGWGWVDVSAGGRMRGRGGGSECRWKDWQV